LQSRLCFVTFLGFTTVTLWPFNPLDCNRYEKLMLKPYSPKLSIHERVETKLQHDLLGSTTTAVPISA
jgi:hypothetical protein